MRRERILTKFDRLRDAIYARYERRFPSAVEVRLIEVLGGTTFTIGRFRHNNRPMTLTLSRGRLLRSRRFRRMVLDGQGVLANDICWAIGILGADYEQHVIDQYQRDEQLEQQGWRLVYVRTLDLWQNPNRVRHDITQFLVL